MAELDYFNREKLV